MADSEELENQKKDHADEAQIEDDILSSAGSYYYDDDTGYEVFESEAEPDEGAAPEDQPPS
jgi:hypothetical protein